MERELMNYLLQELLIQRDEEGNELDIDRVDSFETCGILTNDKGFVITQNDGSEYQVFIVRNR